MNLNDFERPPDLAAARAKLLELGDAGFALAGATSLHFLRFKEPRTAVDLRRVGLSGVSGDGETFTIGATTRVCALQKESAPGWVLDRVARRFVNQPIRNMSTLGGNICRVFWWSDFPVALLALKASIVVQQDAGTTFSAQEFFDARPHRLLRPGDIVLSISVPARVAGTGFGYRKEVSVSASFSMATAAACVKVENGRIAGADVAAGAALGLPQYLSEVSEALVGVKTDRASVEQAVVAGTEGLRWRGREGMTAAYAANLGCVVLADAIGEAVLEAQGDAA